MPGGASWTARIERAKELAAVQPAAGEALRFYERLTRFQQTLYARIEAEAPSTVRFESAELAPLLPWFGPFLSTIAEIAPPPLARSATELAGAGQVRWQEVLLESWPATSSNAPLLPAEALIGWTFLQPFAEALAALAARAGAAAAITTGATGATPRLCPLCSSKPQAGVLRPEGHGGKRSLICSLCATEWDYRRIACAACGEENAEKLPVYVAAEPGHVRVEACDTCRRYIKTIDLTKDGHAVPVVDELAAIPLSLWAEEHDYTKVKTNLLGL